jgi:ubiquinone/menaquinone biosynthesis C-methylase UbiE
LLSVLRQVINFDSSWEVADVGAGTGISSELLLDNGNSVIAVEPNTRMRAAADERLGSRPGFRSVSGSAEETGLQDGSVDLVLAAQAFHWFDHVRAAHEFRRILRRPSWVCLVWNLRQSDSSRFMSEYDELVQRYRVDRDSRTDESHFQEAVSTFFSGRFQSFQLRNDQVLDFPSLQGRLMSSSYAPKPDHPNHPQMMAALEQLFRSYERNNAVTLVHQTDIYVGQLGSE